MKRWTVPIVLLALLPLVAHTAVVSPSVVSIVTVWAHMTVLVFTVLIRLMGFK